MASKKKVASPKLDDQRRAVMAAILGISNLGMDVVFQNGPRQTWKPEDVGKYFRENNGRISVESAVHAFGNGFLETDEMADMFVDESNSWYKSLKTVKDVEDTRYGDYLRAMEEQPQPAQ